MKTDTSKTGLVPCRTKLGLSMIFTEQELVGWLFDPTTKFTLSFMGHPMGGDSYTVTIRFCDRIIRIEYEEPAFRFSSSKFIAKYLTIEDEPMYLSPYLRRELTKALPFIRRCVQRAKLGAVVMEP